MIVYGGTIRARQSLRHAADALERPDRARCADMTTPPVIEADVPSHPVDVTAARACVDVCRALRNARAFRPYVRAAVMPGPLSGAARAD